MSHTISAKKAEGFHVEVRDWNNGVVHSAWYQDREEAQAAASHWEKLVTWNLVDSNDPALTIDGILSDDELLKELLE